MKKVAGAYRFVRTYGQHLPLAWEAVVSFRCHLRLLAGTLKGTEHTINLLYVGRGSNHAYLLRAVFDDFRVVESADATLLSYRGEMARLAEKADVVIADIGWPYHGLFDREREYAQVPDWINLAVELPDSWEGVVRNFRRTARKHDMRLIRRNRYRCETVRSAEAGENFYDEMYVPFATHRFLGDSAVAPRRHVLQRARQGCLLHILQADAIVAAGVVYPEGDILFSLWLGLPAAHLEPPPEAAISALYYFGIQHAFDEGYRCFDFGGTRAFLNDGPLQFKRRWGPIIEDAFSPSSILIKPANSRNGAIFCQQVPVLKRTARGLEAVFVRADAPVDADTFQRLEKDHGCAGIDRMTVIEISDRDEMQYIPSGREDCEYRIIRCPLERLAECYAS